MGIFSRFKNKKENKDTNFLENYIKSKFKINTDDIARIEKN